MFWERGFYDYKLHNRRVVINTFGETVYLAVPNIEGDSSILAAIKIKDVVKGEELLNKIQSSGSGSKLIPQEETYHGVNIYILKSSSLNIPLYTNLLQALNKKSSNRIALAQSSGCQQGDSACLQSSCFGTNTLCSVTPPTEEFSPALTILDRYVVLGGSRAQIRTFIDNNQSKQKTLKDNQSYVRVAQEKPSLASAYFNIESLINGLSQSSSADKSYYDIFKGYKSWSGQVSAETTGFVSRGELYYDAEKADVLTAKILSDKDSDLFYAKTLPQTTGFYGEEGNFGAKLAQIANIEYSKPQTINEVFDTGYGVKLSDLALLFSGKYSVAYLPKSSSGMVLQAEVSDAKTLSSSLDIVKTNIEKKFADAGATLNMKYEDVGGSTVTTFDIGDYFGLGYDTSSVFSPSYAIKDNRLLISSNKSGVTDLLILTGETLEGDEIMKNEIKTVGVPNRLFAYANNSIVLFV